MTMPTGSQKWKRILLLLENGPHERLAKRTTINGETDMFYYHIDHFIPTRLVTDSDKNIVAAVIYHPFGEPCAEEGSEEYLFTGKEMDSSGLYYFGARYYDSQTGTFVTRFLYLLPF